MQEMGVHPWVSKMPWSRKWQPTLVVLPGKSRGQRSLAGYSPWGCREFDMAEGLSTHVYNIQRIIHKGTHQSI